MSFAYARSAITVRALDYLLKPYDEQELMLVLEEAMRLTEARMGAESRKRADGCRDVFWYRIRRQICLRDGRRRRGSFQYGRT